MKHAPAARGSWTQQFLAADIHPAHTRTAGATHHHPADGPQSSPAVLAPGLAGREARQFAEAVFLGVGEAEHLPPDPQGFLDCGPCRHFILKLKN